MSSATDRSQGADDPYAPRWSREPAQAKRRNSPLKLHEIDDEDGLAAVDDGNGAPAAPDRPEGDFFVENFRVPRSLDPGFIEDQAWPPRRPRPARRGLLGVLGRLTLAVSVATVAALLVVGKFPPAWNVGTSDPAAEQASFGSRSGWQAAGLPKPAHPVERASEPPPQLTLAAASARGTDEPLPLGVWFRGAGNDAVLAIGGLPTGATISTGAPSGINGWRLTAADVGRATVRPPPGFVGAIDLAVELRLANDTVADRRSVRLEWSGRAAPPTMAASPVATAASAPSVPPPAASAPPVIAAAPAPARSVVAAPTAPPATPAPDSEEVATLIRRGEDFIAAGDIAAARLVLLRAAEAGNARAALALGASYDPIALEKLGVYGIAADIATARSWYERAVQLGSAEAPRRLDLLASRKN